MSGTDFLDYRELADPKSLSDAARELLTISEKPTEFVFLSWQVHQGMLTVFCN